MVLKPDHLTSRISLVALEAIARICVRWHLGRNDSEGEYIIVYFDSRSPFYAAENVLKEEKFKHLRDKLLTYCPKGQSEGS